MIESINKEHTLYSVHLTLETDETISVGKLGTFLFEKGQYIYVGSAKRAIISRLARHQKMDKIKRWHLDYFRPYCQITSIITYEDTLGECGLAEKIRKQVNGSFPIKGFGASDCRCVSHLIKVGREEKE